MWCVPAVNALPVSLWREQSFPSIFQSGCCLSPPAVVLGVLHWLTVCELIKSALYAARLCGADLFIFAMCHFDLYRLICGL